jgi:hypothetical protein
MAGESNLAGIMVATSRNRGIASEEKPHLSGRCGAQDHLAPSVVQDGPGGTGSIPFSPVLLRVCPLEHLPVTSCSLELILSLTRTTRVKNSA